MNRRTWPPRPDDTRPMPPARTAAERRPERPRPERPRPPHRVTAERRAEKRRDSLVATIACMALLIAIWALIMATAARDALLIGGLS